MTAMSKFTRTEHVLAMEIREPVQQSEFGGVTIMKSELFFPANFEYNVYSVILCKCLHGSRNVGQRLCPKRYKQTNNEAEIMAVVKAIGIAKEKSKWALFRVLTMSDI